MFFSILVTLAANKKNIYFLFPREKAMIKSDKLKIIVIIKCLIEVTKGHDDTIVWK